MLRVARVPLAFPWRVVSFARNRIHQGGAFRFGGGTRDAARPYDRPCGYSV